MSKKHKKRVVLVDSVDMHHILFQRRFFSKGYARALCQAFVRPVPVIYHREFHSIVKNVPVPDGELCRKAWLKYEKEREVIDSYDVCRAIAWLYVNIPDKEFREVMQFQLDFFTVKLKKSR